MSVVIRREKSHGKREETVKEGKEWEEKRRKHKCSKGRCNVKKEKGEKGKREGELRCTSGRATCSGSEAANLKIPLVTSGIVAARNACARFVLFENRDSSS